MYFTLDKIDSVARQDGVAVLAVQTDHRSAAEIEEEGPLSTLFAIAKAIGAARSIEPTAKVIYVCAEPPPRRFCSVLAASGAELHVGDLGDLKAKTRGTIDADALTGLAAAAMALLASKHGAVRDLDGLRRLETEMIDELAALRADFAEEPGAVELPYWTAVLELSAVAAKVLGAHVKGARWVVFPKQLAHEQSPFILVHDDPEQPTKVIVSFIVDKAIGSLSELGGETVSTMIARAIGKPIPLVPKKAGFWSKLRR